MRISGIQALLGLCLCCFLSLAGADGVVVVGHPTSGIDALTQEQVAAIYLGRTAVLPNGVSARPIDRGETEAIRLHFYDALTGKTPAEIKSYWTRLVFSGTRTPPPVAPTAQEAKALLARYPGAITYLHPSEVDASVRTLVVLK